MNNRNQLRARNTARTFRDKVRRVIKDALLGDGSGNLAISGRPGWYYGQMHGDPDQVFRFCSGVDLSSLPENYPIFVEETYTGRGGYIYVGADLSFYDYSPAPTNQPTYVAAHHAQHERRDGGEGGSDPVEVYPRMLARGRAQPQTSPDLTLLITGHYNPLTGTWLADYNSPTFVAPTGGLLDSTARIDLLYEGADDAAHVVQGTVAHNSAPAFPALVSPGVPLAMVYLTNSTTTLVEANIIRDARLGFSGLGTAAHILGTGGPHSDAPANQADGFLKRNAANGAWEEVPYGTTSNTVAEGDHTHGSGADPNAVHVNAAGEIDALTEKIAPVSTDLVIIEDSEDGNNKKKVQAGNLSAAATPNRAAFTYLAALLEPDALEIPQINAFSYAIAAGVTKYLISSWYTALSGFATNRFEQRNPSHPTPLRGVTLAGSGAGAIALLLDPSLPSYADAEATYYARLNMIPTLPTRFVPLNGTVTTMFLPGPYGSLILNVTEFDYTWIVGTTPGGLDWNLWDEKSDVDTQRVGDGLLIPVSKLTLANVKSNGGGGTGGILCVHCPSTWSKVTDPLTYLFRDDFMGASLDTASVWTRAQSSAGNIEINTNWSWIKLNGDGNWGNNGAYSQYSRARASGVTFLADVFIERSSSNHNILVGLSDGAGQSYTNFAHGIDFTTGNLQIFENGTSRGVIGAYAEGNMYRVRITVGAGNANATYEIQGGAFAALGSGSWSSLTPVTSSSATANLHAGVTALDNKSVPDYVGDVRLY